MTAEALKLLFQYNHYAIGVNARDLTHQESLIGPGPAGNCANWVLGHIVQNRGAVLSLLGEQPVWDAAEGERYKRGSAPIAGGAAPPGAAAAAKPFPEIFEALDRSQERILAGLSRVKEEDLGSAGTKGSLISKLAGLQFHEAYHAGQLGLLRRIAGKKGAIQ
jgi:DinB family protein